MNFLLTKIYSLDTWLKKLSNGVGYYLRGDVLMKREEKRFAYMRRPTPRKVCAKGRMSRVCLTSCHVTCCCLRTTLPLCREYAYKYIWIKILILIVEELLPRSRMEYVIIPLGKNVFHKGVGYVLRHCSLNYRYHFLSLMFEFGSVILD